METTQIVAPNFSAPIPVRETAAAKPALDSIGRKRHRRYGKVSKQLRYFRRKRAEALQARKEEKKAAREAQKAEWKAKTERWAAIRKEKAEVAATKEAKRLQLLAEAPPTKSKLERDAAFAEADALISARPGPYGGQPVMAVPTVLNSNLSHLRRGFVPPAMEN
jgi:hypothetical protein